MKIQFCGAARTVTGSSHLLILEDGYKILLDCGLFQGQDAYDDENNLKFLFRPEEIDCLVLSHAHIDHAGRIPKLVKEGFRGRIICTSATKDLSEIMLADSAHIQEKDTQYENKKRKKRGLGLVNPLYSVEDAQHSLKQFVSIKYEEWYQIKQGVEVLFRDNGHILGSGSVSIKIKEGDRLIKVGFTGDIGRPNRPILKDPKQMDDVDVLLCESTYGGRIHEAFPDDLDHFYKVIKETCIDRRGKIIIPAFSIGRTQEIVYMLDKLHHEKNLDRIPVYVDSPLSTNATEIYRNHTECFDEEISAHLQSDPNPFGFNNLQYITEVEESKNLNMMEGPAIIISASGMAEAGRVIHHISNNIENENNTILMVGYCAKGTLGARIRNGEKEIKLFGEMKQVKARVELMDSFSAHGDQKEMLDFLDNLDRKSLQKIYLVRGDYEEGQMPFKKCLEDKGFEKVLIPEKGEIHVV